MVNTISKIVSAVKDDNEQTEKDQGNLNTVLKSRFDLGDAIRMEHNRGTEEGTVPYDEESMASWDDESRRKGEVPEDTDDQTVKRVFTNMPTLQRETGIDFSQLDLADPRALAAALEARGIELDTADRSPQQILNALCARYIEDRHCRGSLPTLIFHHPTVMSPLAKGNPDDDMLTTKRFEVFIGGKEYINAYEEENCPQAQLQKFEAQQQAQEAYGDRESLAIDHAYVDAMKWGMPPIGGFGVGVDRLCMLLTGDTRIERVLSFGTIDDIGKQ